MTREFTAQYGDLIISDTYKRYIDGKYTLDKDFTKTTVTFAFIIVQDTEANFNTEIATVEAALRQPFRDFVWKQNSSVMLVLSHSQGTGLNTQPKIVKREDMVGTGRSRKYTVEISCEMPADNVSKVGLPNGLREAHITISTDPQGKLHVDISGTVTAITTTKAFDQYRQIYRTYTMSIINGLGGVFEQVEKPKEEFDQTNKILHFSTMFEEIIFPQAGGSPDNPAITRQVLRISRNRVAPGDTPIVKRLETYTAIYSAYINKGTQTSSSFNNVGSAIFAGVTEQLSKANTDIFGGGFSDVKGGNSTQNLLDSFWQGTVKPFIISQIKNLTSSAFVAVVEEKPAFEFDNNIITGSITCMVGTKEQVFEETISVDDYVVFGETFVGAWTGDPKSHYNYTAFESIIRTITDTYKIIDDPIGGAGLRGIDVLPKSSNLKNVPLPPHAQGLSYKQLSSRSAQIPKVMGLKDGGQIPYVETTITDIYRFYKDEALTDSNIYTPSEHGGNQTQTGLFGGAAGGGLVIGGGSSGNFVVGNATPSPNTGQGYSIIGVG